MWHETVLAGQLFSTGPPSNHGDGKSFSSNRTDWVVIDGTSAEVTGPKTLPFRKAAMFVVRCQGISRVESRPLDAVRLCSRTNLPTCQSPRRPTNDLTGYEGMRHLLGVRTYESSTRDEHSPDGPSRTLQPTHVGFVLPMWVASALRSAVCITQWGRGV